MRQLHKLIIPLLLATGTMMAILWLPFAVGADGLSIEPAAAQPANLPNLAVNAQVVIGGMDVQLSASGARLPAVAANNNFVAIVYQQGGNVFIRSTKGSAGWVPASSSVGQGTASQLAFSGPAANTVHVVWLKSDSKAIQHATCTLAETSVANCGSATTIHSNADDILGAPDIAVDSSGRLHVAWVNQTKSEVETKLSNDGGSSWSTVADTGTATNPDKPVLATANGFVHLAYEDNGGAAVRYRRSSDSSHNWSPGTIPAPAAGYATVSNPSIAAAGSYVYLVWDNHDTTGLGENYGLTGALSTNSGGTWPGPSDPNAAHITSTRTLDIGVAADKKLSKASGPPSEEIGLRPSVVVTDTSNFVVVWQQRLASSTDCSSGNGTSEIYFAEAAKPGVTPSGNWWVDTVGVLADDTGNYSIDPDIVIDPNGERHIVFMKAAPTGACAAGGGSNDYAIYYRGPFTEVQRGGIYIPIVFKQFQ